MNRALYQLADDIGEDHGGRPVCVVLGERGLSPLDFHDLKSIMANRHPTVRLEARLPFDGLFDGWEAKTGR